MKKYYFDGKEMNDGDVISCRKDGHYFRAVLGTPEFDALTKELVENGILKIVDDTQENPEEEPEKEEPVEVNKIVSCKYPLSIVSKLIENGEDEKAIKYYKDYIYNKEIKVATSIVLSIIAMYDKEQEGM